MIFDGNERKFNYRRGNIEIENLECVTKDIILREIHDR